LDVSIKKTYGKKLTGVNLVILKRHSYLIIKLNCGYQQNCTAWKRL